MRRLLAICCSLTGLAVASFSMAPLAGAGEALFDYTQGGIARAAFGVFNGSPSYDEFERYIAEARRRTANYELDETIELQIFELFGFNANASGNTPRLTEWQRALPRSALPVLAPLSGRLQMTTQGLVPTFATLAAWHPAPEQVAEVRRIKAALLSVKPTASADPYWYTLMAQLLIAERAPTSEVEALVDEGLAKHPSNIALAVVASNHFLDKWSGSSDAFEDFAARMADRFADRDGQAMYARIYAQAMQAQYAGQLFEMSKLDWQRLMTGLRDLVARRPSMEHLNQAAVMACLGGNRELTRNLLVDSRFLYHDAFWYQIKKALDGDDAYSLCRHWAGSKPAQPAAASPPTATP